MKYCFIALLFLIDWTGGAAAVDRFAALGKMIIPENVSLGMSSEDFTASRPAALEVLRRLPIGIFFTRVSWVAC